MSTKTPNAPTKLDDVIDKALDELSNTTCGTEEYAAMTQQLSTLYKMRETYVKTELSVIESEVKQREVDVNLELKNKEDERKRIESEASLEFKTNEVKLRKREVDANIDLRTTEIDLKTREVEANIELKDLEIEQKRKTVKRLLGVSPDTLAVIAANVVGIAMIIGYERANIITTKAIGFVQKLR